MAEQTDTLSERELEILQLVATGAANKEIARQLQISPNTVKVHLRNIFGKIGVASRTEATLYAIQTGLTRPVSAATGNPEAIFLNVEAGPDSNAAPTVVHIGDNAPLPEVVQTPLVAVRQNWWQVGRSSRQRMVFGLLAAVLLVTSLILVARWLTPAGQVNPAGTGLSMVTPTSSNRWTSKASLPSPRKGMGAVEYDNNFYLIGGETDEGFSNTLLRYQPTTDTWQTLASKPAPVSDVQAAVLGEKIYVPGGRLADGKETALFEVYNPRENTWAQLAALPQPVSAYALAAFEGRLYLFGGKQEDHVLDSVFEYRPDEDLWQVRAAMPQAAAYAGAAVVGNKIFLIGGSDGQKALTTTLAYYPTRDASGEQPWERYTPLPDGRYAMGVTSLSNVIYLAGGLSGPDQVAEPAVLQYLTQSNQWAEFTTSPDPVGAHGVLLASAGFLNYLGGEIGPRLSDTNQAFQALYSLSIPLISNEK